MTGDGMPTDICRLDVICLHGKDEADVRPPGAVYRRSLMSKYLDPAIKVWGPDPNRPHLDPAVLAAAGDPGEESGGEVLLVEALYWLPERPGQARPDPHWTYHRSAFGRGRPYENEAGQTVHPPVPPNPNRPHTVADAEGINLVCQVCAQTRHQPGRRYRWDALSPFLDGLVRVGWLYVDLRFIELGMTREVRRPRAPRR